MQVSPKLAKQGMLLALDQLSRQLRAHWAQNADALESAVKQRVYELMVEQSDLIELRLAEVRRRGDNLPSHEQVQQLREGRIAAAERRVAMAKKVIELRMSWLKSIPRLAREARPTILGALVVRPIPFSPRMSTGICRFHCMECAQ